MSTRPSVEELRRRLTADGRPIAVIFRSPLFNASETFVRMQALGLERYQPLVVGLEDHGNSPPGLAERIWTPSYIAALGIKISGRSAGIATALAGIQPALVHAHFAPDALTALPLARRWDVPLIASLRGHDITRTRRAMLFSGRASRVLYALLQHRLMAQGQRFLAVSDALARHAVERGYPAERTLTHYNGVDLTRFGPRDPRPGLILHVGRLVEKKGTDSLIAAFARVRSSMPGATLAIIGEGPKRAALERRAAQAGVGDAVQFLGHQPPARVAEWMSRAAVVAVPSRRAADGDSEGLPNVALEAAAAGAPVVATRHGGLPEVVADGRTGLLVDEDDGSALAEALLALLRDPQRAAEMGAAGRERMRRDFDVAVQMERLETLYDDVRASHAASTRLPAMQGLS